MGGLTFMELGGMLFKQFETSCSIENPGCPFANGAAEFIGRNNDHYAKIFCSEGCSPLCTRIMIEDNKSRYDKALRKMEAEQ